MTAWSTTAKPASVTLSNSNLTATKTSNSDGTVLADTSYSTGKRVFAVVFNSAADVSPGLARSGSATNVYAGDNATSLSVISGTGIYYNGGVTTPAPTWSNGDTCFIAVDFGASRMWWKDGAGGTWTGTAAGNPDAGTNGYNISTLQNSGALFPALGIFTNGTQATLDPTASGHGLSTFTPWDASGSQTLTPSLFTNSQTFYAATVTRGAVNLAPTLLTNTQTFYGPSVSARYALTPAKYDNAQTFYAATVVPGAVSVAPALLSNAQTFYSASVTQSGGTQTLLPGALANTQTFYGPAVVAGAVSLSPGLYTNQQTFYAPAATVGAVTISPTLVENVQAFYAPTVTAEGAAQTLLPSLFANDNVFFGATVTDGSAPVQQPITSSGSATSWSPKTLSRIAREAERAKSARKARPIIIRAVGAALGGSDEARAAAAEAVSETLTTAPITQDTVAEVYALAERILALMDDEDAEMLLLSAA